MAVWRLFRKRNSDGSTKDWAVTTHSDGSISTRWGKTAACLPSVNTRNGVRQFDIEKQKQAKGYVFVAEVDIDSDGTVTFPMQNQNSGNQQVVAAENHEPEADHSRSLVEALYWHIDCKANSDTCINLDAELRRMLDEIQSLQNNQGVSETDAEPELVWDG